MTTIVYKDGILAADTRLSKRATDGYSCSHCGTKEHCSRDNSKKLIVANSEWAVAEYQGSKVLAYAAAGSSSWTTAIEEALERGKDFDYLSRGIAKVCRGTGRGSESAGVIVVTTGGIFLNRFSSAAASGKEGTSLRFPLSTNKVLTLGSGSYAAYAAATVGKLGAAEAVGVAGACDRSTSMIVDWVDCSMTGELESRRVKFDHLYTPDYML